MQLCIVIALLNFFLYLVISLPHLSIHPTSQPANNTEARQPGSQPGWLTRWLASSLAGPPCTTGLLQKKWRWIPIETGSSHGSDTAAKQATGTPLAAHKKESPGEKNLDCCITGVGDTIAFLLSLASLPASPCRRGAAAAGSHWRCPVFSGAATRFWWAATDPQRFASPSRLWCEPGSTSLRRPVTRQITCGWSGAGTRVAISRGGRFGQGGVRGWKQTKNKERSRNVWSCFGEAGEELIKAPLRFPSAEADNVRLARAGGVSHEVAAPSKSREKTFMREMLRA